MRVLLDWKVKKKLLAEEVVRILYRRKAILIGEFTLTSGMKSPYYIDLRVIPSYPLDFDKICDAYAQMISNEIGSFDKIAGVPTAGIPFATLIAYKLKKPLIYVRKRSERLHGRGKLVEGVLLKGERVILVDDVATTGISLLLTAESIINHGGVVAGGVVLVDREQGAEENLKSRGIQLYSLVKISSAAKLLFNEGLISKECYNKMIGVEL
ncbi:MAG TPA: orotate phosphoribosyltransferase [Candidatus Bathyarchaeota archaeon]|nr:orotate phosphoribosyltransferase [Candidatus Bathyarchaeota archaeon]